MVTSKALDSSVITFSSFGSEENHWLIEGGVKKSEPCVNEPPKCPVAINNPAKNVTYRKVQVI